MIQWNNLTPFAIWVLEKLDITSRKKAIKDISDLKINHDYKMRTQRARYLKEIKQLSKLLNKKIGINSPSFLSENLITSNTQIEPTIYFDLEAQLIRTTVSLSAKDIKEFSSGESVAGRLADDLIDNIINQVKKCHPYYEEQIKQLLKGRLGG